MTAPRLSINDQQDPPGDHEFIAKVVGCALHYLDRPQLEVSLLLCDEKEIARLHGEFLGDPTATDVITFPLDDDSVELAISVERAQREAQARGHTYGAELALYIVHGLLHACGYDDIEAEGRCKMRAAEGDVLRQLGLQISADDSD